MPLADSQRFWVKPLQLNAVVNFIIYEAVFYALYWSSPEMADNKTWRVLLLASLAAGALIAFLPAYVRYESEEMVIYEKQ